MHSNPLFDVLQTLVSIVPLVSVVLYGLVVAAHRWDRHPRVSLLAMVACSLLLATAVGSRILTVLIARHDLSIGSLQFQFFILGLLTNLGTAIAIGLLLWAAFGWRGAPGKRPGPGQEELF